MSEDDDDLDQYFTMGGMVEGTFTEEDLARLESLGPEGALEALLAEVEAEKRIEGHAAHRYRLRAMSIAYGLGSEPREAAWLTRFDALLETRVVPRRG